MNPTFQTLTVFIGGDQENQWKTLGLSDAHARILEDIRCGKNKRYGLIGDGFFNFLNSIDPYVRYYVSFVQLLEGSVKEYEVVQVSIPQETMKTFEFNESAENILKLVRAMKPSTKMEIRLPAIEATSSEYTLYGTYREEDEKTKREEDQLLKQKQELEKKLLEVKQKLAQYR